MIEVALVFDRDGRTLHWHEPAGRSSTSIPDSRRLWDVMWEHRGQLGGVAHTHPGSGEPMPSQTDVTTWSACELGLGRRLVWPIVTVDRLAVFAWTGPRELDYDRIAEPALELEGLEELKKKSEEVTDGSDGTTERDLGGRQR